MKIESESQLAVHMGRALANYANQVQNGLTQPFRKFMEGATSVNLKVTLDETGLIHVESLDEPKVEAAPEIVLPMVEPEEPEPKPRRKKTPE